MNVKGLLYSKVNNCFMSVILLFAVQQFSSKLTLQIDVMKLNSDPFHCSSALSEVGCEHQSG